MTLNDRDVYNAYSFSLLVRPMACINKKARKRATAVRVWRPHSEEIYGKSTQGT